MHQFLYHNGFPAQPSTGSMFLSPAAATAEGIKFSLLQFKPGTNDGNLAHIGLQSGSSFITAPVGYAPASSVPSGSSMGSDDIVASQLKESQIYSIGQQVGFTHPLLNLNSLHANILQLNYFRALLVINLPPLFPCPVMCFVVCFVVFCRLKVWLYGFMHQGKTYQACQ